MAKTHDAMPEPIKPRGRDAKYPWGQWTDGRVWEVEEGEDFDSDPTTFRKQVRTYARRKGLEVVTSIRGTSVFFRFSAPDGEGE